MSPKASSLVSRPMDVLVLASISEWSVFSSLGLSLVLDGLTNASVPVLESRVSV